MSDMVLVDMVHHTPKGCDSCTRTNKEKIFVEYFRQSEYTLGATINDFTAGRDFTEHIVSAGTPIQVNNYQFEYIGVIGPAGN